MQQAMERLTAGGVFPEELRAWLDGAKDLENSGHLTKQAVLEGGDRSDAEFCIEQRWNAEFGEWQPCRIKSNGAGSYTFCGLNGTLLGQQNAATAKVAAAEEDASMMATDVVAEWDDYHIFPRREFWEGVLSGLQAKGEPVVGEPVAYPMPILIDDTSALHVGVRLHVDGEGVVSLRMNFADLKGAPIPLPAAASHEWGDLRVRCRAVVDSKAGVVFLVSDDGEMLGFCYDDPMQLWETLTRADFMKRAVPETDTPAGAVRYVLKGPKFDENGGSVDNGSSCRGSTNGSAQRAVCAVLKDCLYAFDGQWEAYLSYHPLACPPRADRLQLLNSSYGLPPVPYPLEANSNFRCIPPMVSAVRGQNTAPLEPTVATLLAIMLGTEWNRKKNTAEVRRWCLVRVPDHGDCWVKLKNMERLHATTAAVDEPLSLAEIKGAVARAVGARLPSTVHGHARIKDTSRKQMRAEPSSLMDIQTPISTDTRGLRKRVPATGTPQDLGDLGTGQTRWGVATVQAMDLAALKSVSIPL